MIQTDILGRLTVYILNPLILLIFSFGFLVFLWGLLVFLSNKANPSQHNEGKDHMIWGVLGMFIMVAAYGIISLIVNTFGFGSNSPSSINTDRTITTPQQVQFQRTGIQP